MTGRNILAAAVTAVIAGSPTAAYTAQLEEVMVTAQKRSQSVQDIPISVSAISGDDMKVNLVTDIFDWHSPIVVGKFFKKLKHREEHGVRVHVRFFFIIIHVQYHDEAL